ASSLLRAEVALLADAPQPLRARTAVRFHLGTADVGARVVAAGGVLAPGDRRAARLVLGAPVVLRAGDRFVFRSAPPALTTGGGVVVDPYASRRGRPWAEAAKSDATRLALALEEADDAGLTAESLPIRLGVPPAQVERRLAEAANDVLRVGTRYFSRAVVSALEERLVALVEVSHAARPLEPSVSLQYARSQLG